jgi:ornithine cyclodeaminase/alanine dehydrogenase-like protein (mu-crystallin family)
VRTGPADVTMFESVGLAFEDLAVAAALAGPA